MERGTGRRSRSRTGCLRCRQRKIRCDESKPACQRCIKIKVECPGYEERTRLFGLRADECFSSEFDKTCFNSFISQGVQDLASFRPSSKEFWLTIVPQLADIHHTVRHATIALAVIQEPAIRSEIQTEEDFRTIAYFHFNKAIRGFLDSGSSFNVVHKLTCCLLFNELMKMLEMLPAGGEHIKAARSILNEHQTAVANAEAAFEPVIASTFAPMILRCTMDALTYLDEFEIEEDVFEQSQDLLLRMPATLSTYGKAIELMDVLIKYAIIFYQQRSSASKEKIGAALGAFDELLGSASNPDIQRHLPSLQSHQRVATYLITGQEHASDLRLFEEIIKLSKHVSNIDWGPTLGNIPPLLFTAMRCTNMILREQALELLHNLRASERGLTSCMARLLVVHDENDPNVDKIGLPTISIFKEFDPPSEDQRKVGELNNVQQRMVQTYGYSGIFCLTSNIDCDCSTGASSSRPSKS